MCFPALPDRHGAGVQGVRPLPTASEVVCPAPPQTSKRGGSCTTSCFLYNNHFPDRWLAGPPAAPEERSGSERKKGARKVCDLPGSQASKLLAPLLRAHNAFSILRPVGHRHSLAKRQQIKNFIRQWAQYPCRPPRRKRQPRSLGSRMERLRVQNPGIPCLRRGEASCSPR